MDGLAGAPTVTFRRNHSDMKRAIVLVLASLLLLVGVAGCGYSNNSGSGAGTSATSKPGY
jgi:hypothetical protein